MSARWTRGAVVEAHGVPAPAEGPPVAHAPGVVALAVPVDGQGLAADGDAAVDQAGDFVAGRQVVVVGHAVGGPGEVERGLDGLPAATVVVGVLGPGQASRRDAGHGEAELLEWATQVDLHLGLIRGGAEAAAGRDGHVVVDRAEAGLTRCARSRPSTRPRRGWGRGRGGTSRRRCRRPARSRSSTTRSTGPRRRGRGAAPVGRVDDVLAHRSWPACMAVAPGALVPRRWDRHGRRTRCAVPST